MTENLSFLDGVQDANWGATFTQIVNESDLGNIFVCQVQVSDIKKIANKLSSTVLDQSWVMGLDPGAMLAYQQTVAETAGILVEKINDQLAAGDNVCKEFGEIMVYMGASRALESIFSHISIPLSELWKSKASGNDGFDFHTVCPDKLINFGEAKFSSSPSSNPYGGNSGESSGAGGQADGFIGQDKHQRDWVHLLHLVEKSAVDNLTNQSFGVVLAFSLNTNNPLLIFKKAIEKALTYQHLKKATHVYIVGVRHATP